ncbi:DUF131 domain-containing protein [Candidatus Woesearchaeota archaeon]|nr:DUF131 domain-containing protein [Candidatus Woesearchaeota archaeon]
MKKRNMMQYIVPIGILMIFLGVMTVFIGSILMAGQQAEGGNKSSKSGVHVGVGGFIGPIPFGFANSKTALYAVIGLAVFTLIVWLILRYTM